MQSSTAPRCPVSLLTVEGVDPFGFYEELRSHGWEEFLEWLGMPFLGTCR